MWAGGEASREEKPKVLAWVQLAATKASAIRTGMPGGRGKWRGKGEEDIKSIYLTCPPPTCLYLFAKPQGSLFESFAQLIMLFICMTYTRAVIIRTARCGSWGDTLIT